MFQGVFMKMQTHVDNVVQYFLNLESGFIHINQLVHKKIRLTFLGFQCLHCQRDRPIFRQGLCKSCFFESPTAGDWIMRPELSKAHLGIEDRDLEFEKKVQLQPHVVYLAVSSDLKVGVTRKSQLPTRWIDQGAHLALPIVEVPNRYLAGITEVALKEHYNDKTNWRKMLQNKGKKIDLVNERNKALAFIPKQVKQYISSDTTPFMIKYPVESFPQKVQSLNLQKTPLYEGVLKGIKGQYLIFDDQTVCNVRGNEGLVVKVELI